MKSQRENQRLLAQLGQVKLHDHLCVICDSRQEELSAALSFIRVGLEQRQRCIYITAENTRASVVAAARRQGIDAESALKKGTLILPARAPYWEPGSFDADGVIRYWVRAVREAKKAGFASLRIVAEMTWVKTCRAANEELIDLETKANEFVRKHDALALCLYNNRRFPKALTLNLMRTHPLVIYNGLVFNNPYFIPPAEFRGRNAPEALIKHYLENLKDREQTTQALRELSASIFRLQDEERRRIARELHDTTGQNLVGLVMSLASLKQSIARLDPTVRRKFSGILRIARQAARELSTLSFLLHPPLLEEAGLAEALQWFVRGLSHRSGIKVALHLQGGTERLPREPQKALFRIVQEALHNVQRHSGSKRAEVRLQVEDGQAVLEVRDFGRGLLLRKRASAKDAKESHVLGVGITGMRERVRHLGGEMQLTSARPGALLRVIVPVPEEEKAA